MGKEADDISESILKLINTAEEPFETKEIEEKLSKKTTRTKVLHRLNNLRGDGLIKGKFVGPGKGVWIWWNQNLSKKRGEK